METLQQSGLGLIQALQSLSPDLDGFMELLSFLGRIEFYLLVLPFVFWAIDKRLGARLLFVLIFIDIIGSSLKLLFHQPRPYWIGSAKALSQEASYGLPSTHASNTLAVWGYLAVRLKRSWLWIATIVLLLLIGISRLYLGVHFLHDVLLGWLIGAAVVWLFIQSENAIIHRARRQNMQTVIGVAFVLSLLTIVIGQLIQAYLSGISDPAAWNAFAAEARSASYSFTSAGALFGAVAGYVLMRQYAPFQSDGPWPKRALRYWLGIISVLIIYFGLDMLFAQVAADESSLGYALRYVRYAAVTFWITFVAPWLFLRFGLADRQRG